MDPHPAIPMDLPPPVHNSFITASGTTTDKTSSVPAQVAYLIPHQSAPSPNHPPYAEMITSAIAALKEREGSSKTAIAKYIDRVYNISQAQPNLLAHHLDRLRSTGQLVKIRNSYTLAPPPRSAANPDQFAAVAPPSAQPKRRPGRPPKIKPNEPISPTQPQPQPQNGPPQHFSSSVGPTDSPSVGPTPLSEKRKPGRPAKPKPAQSSLGTPIGAQPTPPTAPVGHHIPTQIAPVAHPIPAQPAPPVAHQIPSQPTPMVQSNGGEMNGAEAVFVSLGLSDETPAAKRRPGRPRRSDLGGPPQQKPNETESQPEFAKRKPGRPAKYGPVPGTPVVVNGSGGLASPVRPPYTGKPRGRPKRSAPTVGMNGMQPKKRGRKPKIPQAAAVTSANQQQAPANNPSSMFVPHVGISASVPGAVMVPYAQVQDAAASAPVAGNGGPPPPAPPPPAKRRGRPPMGHGMLKKPRNVTGKLGRPRKNIAKPDKSQNLAAYLEMKNKLEYLQIRIKQTVGIIKPCIGSGFPVDAMNALEQLEELVTEAGVAGASGGASVQVNVEVGGGQQEGGVVMQQV